MATKAKKSVSKESDVLLEQVAREAQKEALESKKGDVQHQAESAIRGPVTFSIESQPFKVSEALGRMSYALQRTEIDVYGKWRDAERGDDKSAGLSETFNAPECYDDITSTMHKGLVRFLEITNPLFMDAFNRVQELSARDKRGSRLPSLTEAERYALDGARGRLADARRAVKRAFDTLKAHYQKRIAQESDEPGKTRTKQTSRAVVDKAIATLQRMVESSKTAPADKDFAVGALQALRWFVSYRESFASAYALHIAQIAQPKGQIDHTKAVNAVESAAVVK